MKRNIPFLYIEYLRVQTQESRWGAKWGNYYLWNTSLEDTQSCLEKLIFTVVRLGPEGLPVVSNYGAVKIWSPTVSGKWAEQSLIKML